MDTLINTHFREEWSDKSLRSGQVTNKDMYRDKKENKLCIISQVERNGSRIKGPYYEIMLLVSLLLLLLLLLRRLFFILS